MLTTGDQVAEEWRIERPLGSGGIGEVYLCVNPSTGHRAAVKVIAPPSIRVAAFLRDRLIREAAVLSRLEHEGIVKVYGWGEDTARRLFYLVMEAIEGQPVCEETVRRADRSLDEGRLRALLHAVCEALAFAHRADVAHRDLKPQNILVRNVDGRPVLVDWGSVYHGEDERLTRLNDSHGLGRTDLYAPPEALFNAAGADPFRWDIYSMGVLVYALLRGEGAPYEGIDTRHALLVAKTTAPLDPGPEFPDALREAVRQATSPLPELRPRHVAQLEALFDAWRRVPPRVDAVTFFVDEGAEVPDPPGPDPLPAGESAASDEGQRPPEPWTATQPTAVPLTTPAAGAPPAQAQRVRVVVGDAPRDERPPLPPPSAHPAAAVAGRRPRFSAVIPIVVIGLALAAVAAVELERSMAASTTASVAGTVPPAVTPVAAPASIGPSSAVVVTPPGGALSGAPSSPATVPVAQPVAREADPAGPSSRAVVPAPVIADVRSRATSASPADSMTDGLSRLLEAAAGESAHMLGSDPVLAEGFVRAVSRAWPTDEGQELAARARRRVISDMNDKVGDGLQLIDVLAQRGQLVAFLGSSKYGQGADFKVALRLRMADRMPSTVRQPSTPADCQALAEVVDVVGRAPVPESYPWIADACAACAGVVGAPVGKCGGL